MEADRSLKISVQSAPAMILVFSFSKFELRKPTSAIDMPWMPNVHPNTTCWNEFTIDIRNLIEGMGI